MKLKQSKTQSISQPNHSKHKYPQTFLHQQKLYLSTTKRQFQFNITKNKIKFTQRLSECVANLLLSYHYKKSSQIDFVLGKWGKEEKSTLENFIIKCSEIILSFGTDGTQNTMNKYNTKI